MPNLIDDSITDDVIQQAVSNFAKLGERRGASRLEKEAFAGLALMLTLLQKDHREVANLRDRIEVLENRNIVTWIINHPRVAWFVIGLIAFDYVARYFDTIRAFLGVK